ncbi:MAG: urea ABC transporter ATP-binding protein UrtD [Actinomycetota bacterium]|nr:urea ABC transporter ATP-binding protein UrtD [Actinomycetota bacterium]PLS75778.1 MAG: urea ABC transporter ATP-binding protein UrtD [Actinomycetota bacterium]
MKPVLEVCGVSVDFDGFRALDGVDLSVARGELRFLIGPNGAGKTTLVDCVTGLTRPTAGEVRFEGRSIDRLSEHQRVRTGIGRSFQTPTVFDSLTVVENLDLAESFRRSPLTMFLRRRRVTDGVATTLERVGLSAVADRPAGALSHGQKQWLEIGMLLVQGPKLLLLDEPVAGMSPQERLDTGALLHELAGGDQTLVVIEHDMAFLRRFARKVTVLHEGKVVSEGTVDEVQADPIVREVYLGRSRDARSGAVPSPVAEPVLEAVTGSIGETG